MILWAAEAFRTASDALVVQGHMLVTAKLHFFNGSPSTDKSGFRNRQKHFRQQGGAPASNCLIDLQLRERKSQIKIATEGARSQIISPFVCAVHWSSPEHPCQSGGLSCTALVPMETRSYPIWHVISILSSCLAQSSVVERLITKHQGTASISISNEYALVLENRLPLFPGSSYFREQQHQVERWDNLDKPPDGLLSAPTSESVGKALYPEVLEGIGSNLLLVIEKNYWYY